MGGLQEAVSQLAEQFSGQGHHVQVVTSRRLRDDKRRDIIEGIKVRWMLFPGLYLSSVSFSQLIKYVAGLLIGVITFSRLVLMLLREEANVVNVHFLGGQAPCALLACKLLKIRCVVSLHGDDVEGLPHRSRIDRWLFKKVLKGADHVTACSRYLLGEAKKLVPKIELKSTAIWNGIRPEEYDNVDPYNHARPYIFAAGRFVHNKGFDILLLAYRQLLDTGQEVDLILAGDGPEKENLVSFAKELSLPIAVKKRGSQITDNHSPITYGLLFWGRASRKEMVSLMKGCELVVIPSRHESFGIVALEAFAAGKKVLACRVGGLPEIVNRHRAGNLVKANNPAALSAGIAKVLSGPDSFCELDLTHSAWEFVALNYLKILAPQ